MRVGHVITPEALSARYVRMGHVHASELFCPSVPPVSAPDGHDRHSAKAVDL